MMCATGRGTPKCPSAQWRILGPSLRRKNRLRIVSARKKASPERALIPFAMPSLSCENEALIEALAFLFASAAVDGSMPTSSSQP